MDGHKLVVFFRHRYFLQTGMNWGDLRIGYKISGTHKARGLKFTKIIFKGGDNRIRILAKIWLVDDRRQFFGQ